MMKKSKVRKTHKLVPIPHAPRIHQLVTSEIEAGEFFAQTRFYDWVDGNPASANVQHSSGTQVIGTSTKTGVSNPFWKDQCRLGINATTSLSARKFSLKQSYWSGYSIGTSYRNNGSVFRKWDYSGVVKPHIPLKYGFKAAPADVVTDVHNRCIAKFISEVSSARSSENLTGRSIKHFKHDVHSILHPMTGVQKKISDYLTSLEKVKYGKLKGASLYSVITQAYLEFKFGVQPFAQDISDIVDDMVIRDRKRNPSEPVRGSASHTYFGANEDSNVGSFADFGYMGVFQIAQNMQITSAYSEQLKGAVRTGINDDGRIGVIQDNKLLPEDWLPTAFSIMPYAWMVNYFTNIRDIIDAASFRFSDLVWGANSTRDITTYVFQDIQMLQPDIEFGAVGLHSNFGYASTGGNATVESKTITRYAITPATLLPSFAFSIPVTPTPWVNMMAAFSPRIFSLVGRIFT
jgi:hypothetical protein